MSTSYASRGPSHRLVRYLPYLAALVLVAGGIAALIAFLGNTVHTVGPAPSAKPAVLPEQQKTVPLAAAARRVAERFILTAVNRSDLRSAWALTGPELRGGLTYTEWLKGNIPVIPYPADVGAHMKIDYSYKGRALLEYLLAPKKGSGAKPALFLLGVKVYGTGKHRHWLVNYWGPRAAPAVPLNQARG
jgi:hypothetical protein